MLSREDNETITRVGPGTPMGELMRRYWVPALLSTEVSEAGGAPVRVRLLGESLVAFRDTEGRVGLIDEHCPHRGASMYFARNEDCGLRCLYHGWQFDAGGTCIDMPSEPPTSKFKTRVTTTAYPTHESGGIVWTYMGPPETMTPFRDFGTESLPAEHIQATKLHTPCNYLQAMEGNMDSAHISWLHQFNVDELPDDDSDRPGYPTNATSWKIWRHDRAPRLEIEKTWYGYKYAALRATPNDHTHVRISAFCLPFHTMIATIPFGTFNGMFVPMDDENCMRYHLTTRPPNPDMYTGGPSLFELSPYEFAPMEAGGNGVLPRRYVAENDYGIDREAQKTTSFSGVKEFISQDFMVTESMGPIYDRTKEHLGTTDRSIIVLRRQLLDAAKTVAEGGHPPAVGDLDYRSIRSAEKILDEGEDWRVLGTDDDPLVQQFDHDHERRAVEPVAGD